MADELVRRTVKPLGNPRVQTDLPHQHEEGENRIPVIREGLKKVPSQESESRGETVQVGKAGKTDQGHGKTEFNAGDKKRQQQNKRQDTDGRLIHGFPSSFSRSRR